jgi:hypothetical protein
MSSFDGIQTDNYYTIKKEQPHLDVSTEYALLLDPKKMRQELEDLLPTGVVPKHWLKHTEDGLISWNERKAGERRRAACRTVKLCGTAFRCPRRPRRCEGRKTCTRPTQRCRQVIVRSGRVTARMMLTPAAARPIPLHQIMQLLRLPDTEPPSATARTRETKLG